MRFLVTPRPYDNFWSYPGLNHINFSTGSREILHPTTTPFRFPFPQFITNKIIEYLFVEYLTNQDFLQAFELSTLSKHYTQLFYKYVFNKLIHNQYALGLVLRLGLVFELCNNLDDEYISGMNEAGETPIITITRNTYQQQLEIWSVEPEIFMIHVRLAHPFQTFTVGPFYGDVVWCRGQYSPTGILSTNCLHRPVFIFNFVNSNSVIILNEKSGVSSSLVAFSKLLKKSYGPDTVCYCMEKYGPDSDSPFITLSDRLIKF